MSDALKVRAYEAVCAAFYQMPFAGFLGETTDVFGKEGWYYLGTAPRDVRLRVVLPNLGDEIRVVVEWRNYVGDARNPLLGIKTLTVSTYNTTQDAVLEAVGLAVESALNVYKDVLQESGLAGRIADLQVHDNG